MKNEELLKLQIRFYFLSTVTDAQVQDVLTFIDSPAFLREVSTAREMLNIGEVPVISREAVVKTGESVGIYLMGSKTKKYNDKHIGSVLMKMVAWRKILEIWQTNNPSFKDKLDKTTNKILEKLNCDSRYSQITQQAILLGIIGYSNQIHFFVDGEAYFATPTYIIVVKPDTTDKQVKQALKQIRGHYFQPRKKQDGKITTPKRPPYYPKIMDYHDWYWQRVKGLTYAQIANRYVDIHPKDKILDETEIIKGVKKYEKLLLK